MGGSYPLILLLAFGTLWGAALAIAKLATLNGVPPLALAFWQSLGGGSIVLAVCLMRGTPPARGSKFLRFYLVAGLVGLAWPNGIAFLAVPHLGAGLAALFFTLAPVLTYLFAQLIGVERFAWSRAAGIALGFAGTLVLLLPRAHLPSAAYAWMLVSLSIPVSLAAGNLYRSMLWLTRYVSGFCSK